MHRFYGVAIIDGTPYRVMTLMREEKSFATSNGIHSYEVQKIEVLDNELPSTSNGVGSQNQIGSSYPLAKLLKDVEMSYRPGVKVLEESAKQRARLREHRVFHGSGAEFSAFDHSHMGEGEGAQAYGWGTYVTEVEGIGRAYARNPWQMKINELESNISRAKEKLPFMPPSATKTELENNIKEWEEELAKLENGNKHLYTVEIPEDNGTNYLHWEKPLTREQIGRITEKLKSGGWNVVDGNHPTFEKNGERIVLNERAQGQDVYAELEEALGSDKVASEFLASIGFTGISYPAEALSGGRKDAARNFVIFNEKDAQITDHIRFFRTPGGEAYGFTVDGKIYLDPRIATAETPIHEYAHLWADMIRNVNTEAWNDIVGLMKATPIWEEVRGLYPELNTDDEIADEVLAHYSGRRGAERLREAQQHAAAETGKSVFERAAAVAAIERVKQALAKFWQSVAELFHIRFTSAEEVADRVLADMLNGVNPNKVRNSSSVNVAEFAAKHHLNQNDIKKYADSMRSGSLGGASYAFKSIKRSVLLANEGLSLGQFAKVFKPIKNELFSNFGNVEELREEHVQEALNNRNVMEAARKREEAEKEAERKRLEVFEQMSDEALDKAYMEAVRNNDEQRMRDLVNEAARRNGYQSTDEFRMSHRAPSYDEDGTDKSLIDVANNKDNIRDSLEEQFRMNRDRNREESVAAISQAIQEIEQGKNPTVTIYRAVPKSLKEGSVRNGDWVTLSEAYAKQHGRHALNGDYRIMKENVPAANLYWDGNDINEWGYDDKRDYKYKDTRNNRKLNDLIVRDDKGAIIPLSKRFNTRKKDVRFQFVGQQGAAALDKAEEATTRLDNLGVAREDQIFIMENVGKADSLGDSASFDEHQNEDLKAVNERFNEQLDEFVLDNADKINFDLGTPSEKLLLAGVADRPIRLHGSKVAKKMKKHGFAIEELRDLPRAVANPIAVFDNLGHEGNRSVLTELRTVNGNFLVTIDLGKGTEADFDIVSSVFGKRRDSVAGWINKGYMRYVDKEKALNYLHLSAPIAEASDKAELSSATKVVKDFVNPQLSEENNFREGKGELSDDMLSYLNDPMAQMMGKPRGTKKQRAQFAERERGRMQAHAEKLVERLHLTNVEIVTDASQLDGKQRTAKGFYNKRTGKITIVLPNHASTADVEQTLLHEAVAHYGLRQLFGEHFDDFLDMVYRNAEEGIRRKIAEASAKHGWNVRTATEEYLADLAERTDFEHASPQWWAKIKGFFLDMLRGLGFEAMDGQTLTDNELRYVLWRSYENLTEPGKYPTFIAEARDVAKQHALQVGRFAPTETAGSRVAENEALSEEETAEILFRDGNDYQYTQALARDRYERRIKSGMYQTQEALQDSMLGLRTAMESILEAEGRKGVYIEDIDGFENAYLGENRLSSVNQAEAEKFAREQFKVSSKKVCGCNIWVRQNVVASYVLVIGKR